jgi:hypothetical protein
MRSLLTYIACIAVLVAAGAGFAKLSDGGGPRAAAQADSSTSGLQGRGLGRKADWLRLRVEAEGLYPGARRWVRATVRNRTSKRLTLRSVRPNVRDAHRECSGYVTIERRKLTRILPPRSVRRFKLRVAMSPDAVDACQGVKLRVSLRARATRR